MKIENTIIFGFEAAIRGMRNPFDSWNESDSTFYMLTAKSLVYPFLHVPEMPYIGPKDLALALKLIKRGSDHRKFLRFITVTADLTLPRYVWQEVDTYKVGTVRNSCSTMNTLGKRMLTSQDFEGMLSNSFLWELNRAVAEFDVSKGEDKQDVRVFLKGLLPEGFLQKATYFLNYEVGLKMFLSRRTHRLPMWREGCEGSICEWIKRWPYMAAFIKDVT